MVAKSIPCKKWKSNREEDMKISLITYPGHADSAKIQEQN